MAKRDPIFARRMGDSRAALTAATARIDSVAKQLAKESHRITETTVARFGKLSSEKLRDNDPTLRTA